MFAGVYNGYTRDMKGNAQYNAYGDVDTARDLYNPSVPPANSYYSNEPYVADSTVGV